MKLIKLAILAALMAFGAVQADETEKRVELKVMVTGDGEHDGTEVHWISDDLDLNDLAVGEARTVTGESGREVTVTRSEDGMEFNIEGKIVTVPDMGTHGTQLAFVGEDGGHHDVDVDVKVMKMDGFHEDIDVQMAGDGVHMMQAHHPEGVTIISGKPLDESTKDSIRSVLISAGNGEEVTFIDGSSKGRQVKVIKKRVEVIQ